MFIQDHSVNLLTEDKLLGSLFSTGIIIEMVDEVAEWLRGRTANPMCSARVGSNPILVVIFFPDLVLCNMAVKYIPKPWKYVISY